MTITGEHFKELVETIRTEKQPGAETLAPDDPGIEGTATLIPCGGATRDPILVNVTEVSASGIGFRHKAPMRNGQQFILFLPPKEGKSRGILCRVTRWQPVGQDLFEIGAAFEQGLSVVAPRGGSDEDREIRKLQQRLQAVKS